MNLFRPAAFSLFGLLLSANAWGADPPPEFTAAGIVRGASAAQILVPGAGMSIYGRYLAPPGSGCAGSADPQRRETPNPRLPNRSFANTSIYPTELCGTQVLIGDKPAGLLYVSERQINFKVPQDGPENGSADIRVVRMGQASPPVTMKAGFERTTVSLEQTAYTDMPVWLKVELPFEWAGAIRYPFVLGPAGFGCTEVEVRKEGKLLAPVPGSNWMRYGGVHSGYSCGSYGAAHQLQGAGRLPVHLLYRFDTPGICEVRFTLWSEPVGFGQQTEFKARSEWTPIEVLPSKPNQRAEWLDAVRMRAPMDATQLLTDTLPSLLGVPDEVSFEILTGYLYHPDASVRRYAMNGLSYWPEDSTSKRLLLLLHTKGPSDSLIGFLMRQPEFRAAHSTEIVAASLPFLEADSPVLMGGAIAALWQTPRDNPSIREGILRSAEHVVPRVDSQHGSELAQMMAATKDQRAHALLRSFVERGYDQAVPALVSFGDSSDLPRLSALLAEPSGTGNAGDRMAFLPGMLYQSFGNAAVPYLERALKGPLGRFTAKSVAQQLIAAGDPAGFQFAVQVFEQKSVSRFDIIQVLKGQFPELNSASDDAIAAFAKKRAGVE